jgi:hypothetical protein
MSNSLLTDSIIVKESLMELKNQLGFTKHVNRQYDDRFAQEGAKIGDTINIRKPSRYSVTDGAVLNIQDSQDVSVALQLDTQRHVGMAFSSKDLSLSVDSFRERYIKPAITSLANDLDYTGYNAMYKQVWNAVGVPSASALPSTLKGFTQAKAKIAHSGGPLDDLVAIIDPDVEASMTEGLKSLFQSSEQIKKQYEKGVMGLAAGSKFVMSQNVKKHTIGAVDGSPQVKTSITAQGTTSVVIDTITTASITGAYKAGDVVTFGSVYAVNPQTKQSTGQLMQFVVQADANASSNEATISVLPAMYTTGANQNIDAFPLDNALVKVFGGTASAYSSVVAPQNLVFSRDAFALGCADLILPKGMHMAARASDPDSGLSIRLVSGYDIVNDRMNSRLDILFGWKCLYADFACRVVGQPA